MKNKMIFKIDDQDNDDYQNVEIIEIEGEVEFEREGDYLIIRKKRFLS